MLNNDARLRQLSWLIKLGLWAVIAMPFVLDFYNSQGYVGYLFIGLVTFVQIIVAIVVLFIGSKNTKKHFAISVKAVCIALVFYAISSLWLLNLLHESLLEPFQTYPNRIVLDELKGGDLVHNSGKWCGWTHNYGANEILAFATTDSVDTILAFYHAEKYKHTNITKTRDPNEGASQSTCYPGKPTIYKNLPLNLLIVLDPAYPDDLSFIKTSFPQAPANMRIVILSRGFMFGE